MPLESHDHDGGSYLVIPHEHNLRWIMMFYALPKEMFEKLPDYRQMPRNLRAFTQAGKYSDMLMSDQFLEVVWNLYAWMVWHCLRIPGRNGEYRPLPGAWHHYSEDFPIWRITYEIAMHFREIFEHCSNWNLQRLFDLKPDEEMPWLTFSQFCAIVKSMTQFVIDGMNLQPFIDEVWKHRAEEDFAEGSRVHCDFMRSWMHSRTAPSIPMDEIIKNGTKVDGQILFDLPDPHAAFENHVVNGIQIEQFKGQLTEQDRIILQMRNDGNTMQEIADKVGYKIPSAVKKRINKIAAAYTDFISAEYSDFLDSHTR